MYFVCKPVRVAIYINTGRKTMEQIFKELGGDKRKIVLINAGLFDGAFRPCCWLKGEGKLLHSETWSDFGYGWNDADLVLDTSKNIQKYENFISCVALLYNGEALKPIIYPSDMGGVRGRSAVGVRSDGQVVCWCTADGAYALTPECLQQEMMNLGCESALMLDGGISSRCKFPNGTIPGNKSRPYLHNYLVLYLDEADAIPPAHNTEIFNPQTPSLSVPMRTLFIGCKGDDVKWVQMRLTEKGFPCDPDGVYGGKTWQKVYEYQKANKLFPDGIVGSKTRKALDDGNSI